MKTKYRFEGTCGLASKIMKNVLLIGAICSGVSLQSFGLSYNLTVTSRSVEAEAVFIFDTDFFDSTGAYDKTATAHESLGGGTAHQNSTIDALPDALNISGQGSAENEGAGFSRTALRVRFALSSPAVLKYDFTTSDSTIEFSKNFSPLIGVGGDDTIAGNILLEPGFTYELEALAAADSSKSKWELSFALSDPSGVPEAGSTFTLLSLGSLAFAELRRRVLQGHSV
jgi:hypothetical protein